MNEILRVPGAAIPGVLAPTIFFLGLTAVFGNLTAAAGLRHRELPELHHPDQPAPGGRVHRRRDRRQPRPRHRAGLVRPPARLPRPAPGAARRAGALGEPALADPGRRSCSPSASRSGSTGPGSAGSLLALFCVMAHRHDRRLLGRGARAALQDPERGAADAGGDVHPRPDDHRLRAARAAPGLARRHRPDQPADPGRRRRPPGLRRRHRSPGRTPGPRSSRSPGCSPCSSTSPCAACARTSLLSD